MRRLAGILALLALCAGLAMAVDLGGGVPIMKSDGTSDPETLYWTEALWDTSLASPDSITCRGFSVLSTAAFGMRPIHYRGSGLPSSGSRAYFVEYDSTEVAANTTWTITGWYVGVIIYGQSAVVQLKGWE